MKKSKRTAIITALIFILAGGLIFSAALVAVDFDIKRLNSLNFETNTYNIDGNFDNIYVNSSECDINLFLSDDNKCRVVCSENDKIYHNVEVKNGILTVERVDNRKWYEYIGFYFGEMEISVYLPENEYNSADIKSDTGDIEAPKTFLFEKADIETDTGDVDFYAEVKNTLAVKTDTGDIRLGGINPVDLDLETDTGDIAADSVKATGEIRVKTDTGDIGLTDVRCMSIGTESDTGNMKIENTIAENGADFKTDTGDIKLITSDAGTINIETATGDVFGSLLSDKIFITETHTGNVNVPKTVSGGGCTVKTDTGDIRFIIEK